MLHFIEEGSKEKSIHVVRQLGWRLRQAAYKHVFLARGGKILHGIAALCFTGYERITLLWIML